MNITGHDRPGVTYALSEILGRFNARILDIGQALIHDALALGIIVEFTEEMKSSPLLTELLLKAHELGVQIHFHTISSDEYQEWVKGQSRRRFLITILGPSISGVHLSEVSGIVSRAGLNIDRMDRLSGRTPLDPQECPGRVCVELAVSGELANEDSVRTPLMRLTDEHDIDIAFQHDNVYRRNAALSLTWIPP
ncbi:MAG: ACT domain-containing protein [Bryobacteraceae bacterium]